MDAGSGGVRLRCGRGDEDEAVFVFDDTVDACGDDEEVPDVPGGPGVPGGQELDVLDEEEDAHAHD